MAKCLIKSSRAEHIRKIRYEKNNTHEIIIFNDTDTDTFIGTSMACYQSFSLIKFSWC